MNKFKRCFAMLMVSTLLSAVALVATAPFVSSMPLVDKATTQEVQMILSHHGYSLKVDGNYGIRTESAVSHWQKVNGLKITGLPNKATMKSLRGSLTHIWFDGLTIASEPAVRTAPPPVPPSTSGFAPAGLSACDEMSFYRVQAGLPERFEALGWRESNCRNDVTSSTGCCVGYWQNYISSHLSRASAYRERIINECGVSGRSDILGNTPAQKQKQACVTKVVYDISGLSPWA